MTGGSIVTLDNGNLRDHDPYHADRRRAFRGRGLAILTASEAGSIEVTASADGLRPATVRLRRGAGPGGADRSSVAVRRGRGPWCRRSEGHAACGVAHRVRRRADRAGTGPSASGFDVRGRRHLGPGADRAGRRSVPRPWHGVAMRSRSSARTAATRSGSASSWTPTSPRCRSTISSIPSGWQPG